MAFVVFQFRYRRALIKSKGTKLAVTSIFLATGLAFFDSIWSLYLESVVNDVAIVGIISGFLALLGVVSLILSTLVIEKFPETKLWIWSILISSLGILAFYFLDNIWMIILLAVIVMFSGVIRRQSHGILIRDLTNAKNLGKAEGLQYALSNIGWMIGPLIAGLIASIFGIRAVFIIVVFFLLLSYVLFKRIGMKDKNRFTEDDGTLKSSIKNLRQFFNSSEMKKNYLLKGGIQLYWGTIFLFIPIFIVQQGLPMYWFGIFLFSVTVPLVISEYYIGNRADKVGFKKFFVMGYLILTLGSISAFFFTNVLAWIIIFVIASFGAAMLEGTTESYFFKIVKRKQEEKFYGPFNTSLYLVSGIGKLIISGALFFLANQFVFLLLALQMFMLFLVALTIKEKKHRVAN